MFITKKYLNQLIERLEKRFEKVDQRFEAIEAKMATKDDLKSFSTKDDLKSFATKDDLKSFATKDDLKSFATKDDIKEALKPYATKDDLHGLKEKLATWMVEHFYTKDEMDSRFSRLEIQIHDGIKATGVLFEHCQTGLELLSEGHGSLVSKTDEFQTKVDGMHEAVELLKIGVFRGKKPSNKNP